MRKQRTGIVTSNKMNKTAIVQIDRMVPHKKYGKRYRVSQKFAAHDETNAAEIGQTVTIEETRPLSKTKRWTILDASASTDSPTEAKKA